ncbi:DUF2169 domain-containing protein [Sorangium sp. So ce321]|uniref:DUF2169 family type VI secretion system accessory protein n=1 Tax=Sorangium sp. So ce321 TaxID=3133300 RepID=UPI003F5F51D5
MSALPRGAVTPLKGAAATAIAWRTQGRHYITVIAKASFAFATDAVMWRTDPQEILRAEVHHGKNPARSVRWSGDLAPYLGRADVVFTGDAHAPRGTEVQSLPVRLAVYSAGGWVLDKRLLVRDKGPFRQIPLVYERAVCGADGWENPFDREPMDGPANILDLQDPARPAGFAPLARASPVRRRLLGSTPRKALEGPDADIPAGFDWSYFQAAPADQRIAFLQGDEWIVLEHLNPAAPRLQMRLPGARGVARIRGLADSAAADGELLELNADTLRIDGVEQRCTVVWRRIFPVADEDALAAVRIDPWRALVRRARRAGAFRVRGTRDLRADGGGAGVLRGSPRRHRGPGARLGSVRAAGRVSLFSRAPTRGRRGPGAAPAARRGRRGQHRAVRDRRGGARGAAGPPGRRAPRARPLR